MRATSRSSSSADKITVNVARQGHANGERENEQWMRLLGWLKDEHNMDVGEGGLRVECREAEGERVAAVDCAKIQYYARHRRRERPFRITVMFGESG